MIPTVSNKSPVEWKRPQTRQFAPVSRGLTLNRMSDWRAEMHSTRQCSVDGCDRAGRHSTSLWCDMHRQRIAKYGTADLPAREPKTLEDRFWEKVSRGAPDECWEWTACAHQKEYGYGRIGLGGRSEGSAYAHRLSWELHRGPIPEGMTIDHLCLNRLCVNPSHLEVVTPEENSRRVKRRWTHCIHGHEFTEENTYWRKEGRRMCRACRNRRGRA